MTIKILKGAKLLEKKHESTFLIFFHHSERTWFAKYLNQLYVKSWECFVTQWLPMTTILFRIVIIYCPWFKCKYLKNEKLFIVFSFHFSNLHQVLNILREKIINIATLFQKLQTEKDLFRPLSKKTPFQNAVGQSTC